MFHRKRSSQRYGSTTEHIVTRHRDCSTRFRRVAQGVVEEAAERLGAVSWVVAWADSGAQVVVSAAGDGPVITVGDPIEPVDGRDLIVPLRLPNGAKIGVLGGLGWGSANPPAAAERWVERWSEMLTALATAEWEADSQAARAAAATRRAREVEVEALTDALTGVANRRAWDRALGAEERRRRRYGGTAAIVVVDVDGLKQINDQEGHRHGDVLLQLVARIIKQTSRESDVVARIGGDEFAILALNCDEPELAVLVGRLRTALDDEGALASVGGACRRLSAGIADAWQEADGVMFEEKSRRKL